MAKQKRVWSGKGVPVETVIGRVLTGLDEAIIKRAVAAVADDSGLTVKELAELHKEAYEVRKRVLESRRARQSADRERRRRRALEGDKGLLGEPQVP